MPSCAPLLITKTVNKQIPNPTNSGLSITVFLRQAGTVSEKNMEAFELFLAPGTYTLNCDLDGDSVSNWLWPTTWKWKQTCIPPSTPPSPGKSMRSVVLADKPEVGVANVSLEQSICQFARWYSHPLAPVICREMSAFAVPLLISRSLP